MQTSLTVFFILFLISLILVERKYSLKIIVRFILGLIAVSFYVNAIVEGKSIIVFSILLVIVLSIINVFIKNGIHRISFSELLSVIITSIVSSILVLLICKSFELNMFQDEIMLLNGIKESENALFGIFMVGTLGINMDIIAKLISSLDSEKDKTEDVLWKKQFVQGVNIGRTILSEKINMIMLILLGVSLFPICKNVNKGMNFEELCNNPEVYTYILIAIMANIGLILAVLITSIIFACLNRNKTIYKTVSENKVNGKRSLKL